MKIAVAFLNLIYSVMKLAPVKDRIAFISRQYNEKSIDFRIIEEELREQSPETELVFLCKKVPSGLAGKIGYAFHLLKQMRTIATSRAVVLDTYCFGVSALKQREDLVVIQMWHAMGSLKKFAWSIVGTGEGRNPNTAKALNMHRGYTYYSISSETCKSAFDEAYGYCESGHNYDGRNHAVVSPLPRVKLYSDSKYIEDAKNRVLAEYPQFADEKVAVYAPTFRMESDISAEIEKMAKALDGYTLVVKKHPLMDVKCEGVIVDEKFSTYEMMCAADYIVLDYSAVVFEACLLDKPMFFYTFDYDTYMEARDFYVDYKETMPGPIADNAVALAEAIRMAKTDDRIVKEFREKWVDTTADTITKYLIKKEA